MKKEINKNKKDFLAFFLSTVQSNSRDKESAKEFLSSEGLGVDNIIADGLREIKAMQLEIEAEKTLNEQKAMEESKKKAEDWVNNLLSSIDFSFAKVAQEEQLTVSFRNIETLSQTDIREILINHFTLKFMDNHDNPKEL